VRHTRGTCLITLLRIRWGYGEVSEKEGTQALLVCGVCLINLSSAVERNHFVKIQIHTSLYCIIALSNLWIISVCLVFGAMTQLMMKQRNKYVNTEINKCYNLPLSGRPIQFGDILTQSAAIISRVRDAHVRRPEMSQAISAEQQ